MKKFSEEQILHGLTALVLVAALALIGWFAYQFITQPVRDGSFVQELFDGNDGDFDCDHRSVLNGVCVEDEEDTHGDLVAVMVENHPDARPQSGLVDAQVVYEAPVEANYSRFLLLFDKNQDVPKVGPVRSARPYYLDWVSEYDDAMYVHVGGSPLALSQIKQYGLFDLNEFFRGWYFWRSKDRFAPHNAYTSSDLWQSAWEEFGEDRKNASTTFWVYDYKDECNNIDHVCATDITVQFFGKTYEAHWEFNSSTLQYERFQADSRHVDHDLRPILADTVIVQFVTTTVVDNIGRLNMETIGSGKVMVFRDGHLTEGIWKKESREEKTRWYDAGGQEIPLKPGKIWIEVANQRATVTVE